MKVVDPIEQILLATDQIRAPLDALSMQSAIHQAIDQAGLTLTEEEREFALAEISAWAMSTEAFNIEPWCRYFGPSGYGLLNGKTVYSPPIDELGVTAYGLWVSRIDHLTHPVLVARYADLAWELAKPVGKVKPAYRHSIAAIDGYLESISGGLVPEFHDRVVQAIRALQLSRQMGDVERSETATGVLLDLHALALRSEGFWWKTYDGLVSDRKLSVERRADLAASFEGLAARFGDPTVSPGFDPFEVQPVAERLLAYYARIGSRSDANRINEQVGRAFERSASLGDNMRASSLLQDAENAYLDAGCPDDAKRVRLARIEAIRKSAEEMVSFEHTFTITREQMDGFLASVISENPFSTLVRIASEFVHALPALETSLRKVSEGSISGFIPIAVMADDHQAATIGGIDDDLDGRLVQHASHDIQWTSPFLDRALRAAIEKHDLGPHAFAGFADRSGLFDDLSFVIEGVGAWFGNDHMKAIHVLVPQIEQALRAITGKLGQPVTRRHPTMDDREIALGMSEILGNPIIKGALSADLTFFFRTIYTDPRGLNLRNQVAHGLLGRGMINSVISDRLIHTLLVLGVWEKLAEHRKKGSATPDETERVL